MQLESFETIYKKYLHRIERFIQHHFGITAYDAQELAEETFTVLWKHQEILRIDDDQRILAWLYETAKRTSLAFIKEQSRCPKIIPLEDIYLDATQKLEYNDLVPIQSELNERETYEEDLKKIKKILTEKEWQTFEYVFVKRCSTAQVAKILNTTELNIRVRWHRIREKLQKAFRKN